MTGLLQYPNSSFVSVVASLENSTVVVIAVRFANWHCLLPAPFYGTYCWGDHWYSEGNITITTEDLVASPSGSIHQGSFQIQDNTPLNVVGSSFTIQNDLVVNSSSILRVYNSSISVGDTLRVVGSNLEIGVSGSNITANAVILEDGSSLTIVLSADDEQTLNSNGLLTVQVLKFGSLNGNFDTILVQTANGTASEACILTSIENESLIVQISVDSTCTKPAPYYVIAYAVIFPVLGVVFFYCCYFGLLQKECSYGIIQTY